MPFLSPLTTQIARLANRNVPTLRSTDPESQRLQRVLHNAAPSKADTPPDAFVLSGTGDVLTKRLGFEVPVQSVSVVHKDDKTNTHFSFQLIGSEPNRVTVQETHLNTRGNAEREITWVIEDKDQSFHKLVQAKYTRMDNQFQQLRNQP